MSNPVFILASQTFQEHVRNRSFMIALFFSGIMLYMSLLLGLLAQEQELRVLMDFGLSFIEIMALAMAVFGAATGILREMELKTIYLVLTRPISRSHYLLGRYLGLLMASACAIVLMAGVQLSILIAKGWAWQSGYCLAIAGIILKIALATALATFWALASTSVLSALTITGIIWTLGHFIPEISFLVRRTSHHLSAVPMLAIMYLLPNLQLLNFRDRISIPLSTVPAEPITLALGYTLVYSAIAIVLAYALFRKKEL